MTIAATCPTCGMIGCTCYTKVRVSSRTMTQPAPSPQPPTGWQCPLCRVVHAPSVTACRCADAPASDVTVAEAARTISADPQVVRGLANWFGKSEVFVLEGLRALAEGGAGR